MTRDETAPPVARFVVEFGKYVAMERVSDMAGSLGAYGNVERSAVDARHCSVSVFRAGKVAGLTDQLVGWERHKFVRWTAET